MIICAVVYVPYLRYFAGMLPFTCASPIGTPLCSLCGVFGLNVMVLICQHILVPAGRNSWRKSQNNLLHLLLHPTFPLDLFLSCLLISILPLSKLSPLSHIHRHIQGCSYTQTQAYHPPKVREISLLPYYCTSLDLFIKEAHW